MASITITLSDEVLKALRASRSITVALGSNSGRGSGNAGRGNNSFQPGSLPDRLVKWASGRKRTFGIPEVMKRLKVNRAHASMLLTRAFGAGRLRRVRRGAYVAA